MAPDSVFPTGGQIAWQFQVAEQGAVARYGTSSGSFYRQYLPNGMEFVQRYPPKRIDKSLYNVALTMYQQTQAKG